MRCASTSTWTRTLLVGVVVALMILAGFAATLRPARQGVGIQPMDALRADD